MQSKQFICHLNELKSDHGHPVLLNDEQLAMFYVPKEGCLRYKTGTRLAKLLY